VPDGQIKTRVGERHGRSLSRRRRGWRGGPDRDGASYRVYVKRPLNWRPLEFVPLCPPSARGGLKP
jgi:hypothetical protein